MAPHSTRSQAPAGAFSPGKYALLSWHADCRRTNSRTAGEDHHETGDTAHCTCDDRRFGGGRAEPGSANAGSDRRGTARGKDDAARAYGAAAAGTLDCL